MSLRSPSQHYAAADALLTELEGMDLSLPFVRAKLHRANLHAQLAQCRNERYEEALIADDLAATERN